MKILQFNPYQCGAGRGGDEAKRGRLGLKSLNLSLPYPIVRGQNLAPSPPYHLYGAGKTRVRGSKKRRGKIVIPTY